MDRFHTYVETGLPVKTITYESWLLMLGSCFSDYIGEKLVTHKFNALHNPFGQLFNPASISENTRILIEKRIFSPDQLFLYNNQWVSFNHYTGFSHPDRDFCLERINSGIMEASRFLQKADFLFITLGTAWAYKFNETGKIVSNCHKIPSSAFTRVLLEPTEIIADYTDLLNQLKAFNPGLSVVFSLSPVRHLKDGAVDNQKSKSILHYSIDKILENMPGTSYFPAYEIFMDELRDYRFYASDMVHPSDSGIAYIWDRFVENYFTSDTVALMNEINSIVKAISHRPVNPDDPSYPKFLKSTLTALEQLAESHPYLEFSQESNELNTRLEKLKK